MPDFFDHRVSESKIICETVRIPVAEMWIPVAFQVYNNVRTNDQDGVHHIGLTPPTTVLTRYEYGKSRI